MMLMGFFTSHFFMQAHSLRLMFRSEYPTFQMLLFTIHRASPIIPVRKPIEMETTFMPLLKAFSKRFRDIR